MVFEVCGGAVFYYFVRSFLTLDKCIFDFISVQLLGELNQLVEEGDCVKRKEEGRDVISSLCPQRQEEQQFREKPNPPM